jgi:hypothetical protein
MTIFIQILIIISTFISCWLSYTHNDKDEIKYAFKDWKSYPYTNKLTDAETERMMGKPKNVIDIDYETDDGNTVYFEFKPIEQHILYVPKNSDDDTEYVTLYNGKPVKALYAEDDMGIIQHIPVNIF